MQSLPLSASKNNSHHYAARIVQRTISVAFLCLLAQLPLAVLYSSHVTSIAAINLIVHAILLLIALGLCHFGRWQVGRLVLMSTYLSFITFATFIWRENLCIQHFLLIGVLVSNGIYRRHEKNQQRLFNIIMLMTFLGLEVYFLLPFEHWSAAIRITNSITLVAACLLISFMMQRYTKQKWGQLKDLQARTNALLTSFLPQPRSLTHSHWPNGYQERFDNVCVVFADLKGYTQLSLHYDDDEIVAILDSLYRQFDHLANTFNIEKLKTNGDQYMAAAGLPFKHTAITSKQECLKNTLEFSQHLVSTVKKLFARLHMPCDIRVGIAMGTVTGGVIGSQRAGFDIWGKTVNRAARLEQAVTPGYIAVCDVIARNLDTSSQFEVQFVHHEDCCHHILSRGAALET